MTSKASGPQLGCHAGFPLQRVAQVWSLGEPCTGQLHCVGLPAAHLGVAAMLKLLLWGGQCFLWSVFFILPPVCTKPL